MIPMLAGPVGTTVEVTGAITHMCPMVNEVDEGIITLSWRCGGATFELHELAAYLASFADVAISHEALVDHIAGDLARQEGVSDVVATYQGTTAGLDVKVSARIALPRQPLDAVGS